MQRDAMSGLCGEVFSNKCVGASDLAGYFGKKSDMIVHHLAEMRSECHIHPVKNDDRTYFTPDTLDNAKNRGFIPCPHCC